MAADGEREGMKRGEGARSQKKTSERELIQRQFGKKKKKEVERFNKVETTKPVVGEQGGPETVVTKYHREAWMFILHRL